MTAIDPLGILLSSDNASIRYRTLTEICGLNDEDFKIKQLKEEITNSKQVNTIMNKMHPDGYWLQTNRRTGVTLGDGVEYGAYATTHYMLSYLMELGLTKEHPTVAKAAERYLSLQQEDGDWWLHMSCLSGINIRTFVRLGYRQNEHVQKAVNLMLNIERNDSGYLCDMHEKRGKNKKSCYRGSLKMLLAFSELPEYWKHERCINLVEYFLKREGVYNSGLTEFVNKDVLNMSFPVTWKANSWELLLALSRMGYGSESRLVKAWELLEAGKMENGFYRLDNTPSPCPFKAGTKKQGNEWLTFYAILAKKFVKESGEKEI